MKVYKKVYLEYLVPDFGKYDDVNKMNFVGGGVEYLRWGNLQNIALYTCND